MTSVYVNDEGSDMDVSDGEEVTLPHEDLVQDLRNHVNQQVYNPPVVPAVENFMPQLAVPSSSTTYASVAQMAVDDDGYLSDASYRTAPDSPSMLIDVSDNIYKSRTKTLDDLKREYDELKLQQRKNDQERERLNLEMQSKKAENDTLKLQLLELNVRMSIKKNQKKPKSSSATAVKPENELERQTRSLEITNPLQEFSVPHQQQQKKKKKPQKPVRKQRSPSPPRAPRVNRLESAQIENVANGHLNYLYSQSLEPMDNARASGSYIPPPTRSEKRRLNRVHASIENAANTPSTDSELRRSSRLHAPPPSNIENDANAPSTDSELRRSSRIHAPPPSDIENDANAPSTDSELRRSNRIHAPPPSDIIEDAPPPTSNQLAKSNVVTGEKELRKKVRQSHVRGLVTLHQMRLQLVNLYELPTLTAHQRANARELLRRVISYWNYADDFIPTRPDYHNMKIKKVKPTKELLLPDEFYGNVETLNYLNAPPVDPFLLARAIRRFLNEKLIAINTKLNEDLEFRLLVLDQSEEPNEEQDVQRDSKASRPLLTHVEDQQQQPSSSNSNSALQQDAGVVASSSSSNLYDQVEPVSILGEEQQQPSSSSAQVVAPVAPAHTSPVVVEEEQVASPVKHIEPKMKDSSGTSPKHVKLVDPFAPYKIPSSSTSFKPYTSVLSSLGLGKSQPVKKEFDQLCAAESTGGRCNDQTCPYTHFRDFY